MSKLISALAAPLVGIVAEPDRVMMWVVENICELVRKDSSTSGKPMTQTPTSSTDDKPSAEGTDDKPRAEGKLAFTMPRCEGGRPQVKACFHYAEVRRKKTIVNGSSETFATNPRGGFLFLSKLEFPQ